VKGGHTYSQKRTCVTLLSFGKEDSLEILRRMYYAEGLPALGRKRDVALDFLGE
jgi:hypothetical protein